jgi:tetratricopeptide (TPR) repeat protein
LPATAASLCLIWLVFLPCLSLAETFNQLVGYAVSLQGIVEIRRANQTVWGHVKAKDAFMVGDTVRVGARSRADLALVNETVIRLDQNTTIMFSGPEQRGFSIIELIKGAFYFLTNRPSTLKVATPFVNGIIEGTEFYTMVDADKTFITIFKGQVALTNAAGSLTIREGQSAIAMADKAPVIHIVAKPRDAVQWTLYYPPILICTQADMQATRPLDAYTYTCRATELLAVGRVDEAQPELDRALSLSPGYGPALAMKSIVALVQNEKVDATELAQKAVQTDPQSASSWMALSYARQGSFDLDGALKNVEHAVKAEPTNALAWARLSDLWLSLGYLDKALNAAQEAEKINSHISRIQTVLGFAYLSRIKVLQAKGAFEKAILLDQADPLPRLGLGLAMIREGDLEKGRQEIEIAASLDPQNSLIRSYLGKAYYDEKREKQAGEQYALARQFDPQDPTPYLYDAFLKQSLNRPVEAMQNLQKSIDLNDNRAVYRSRLMLDQDLAARSASLGRIYRDLGFDQVAMVEGWKSVNTDPGNYSAHRFLAETYSVLPRHEQGQANEILQSQLLQPININPVPPSMAANNLFILEGTGPGEASFNEFSPLFLRNRAYLQFSGVGGEKNTVGDELIISGVHNNVSISASQYHHETKGFRDNNDRKTNFYNAFIQAAISPHTSIQAEYRRLEHKQGDPELTFTGSYVSTLRQEEEIDSLRFGIRHSPSPHSDILGSFIYQKGNLDTNVIPGLWDIYNDVTNYIAEASYLFRYKPFSLITGLGYRYKRTEEEEIFAAIPFQKKYNEKFANAYVYGRIDIMHNLNLTFGVSGESLRADIRKWDDDQLNPKLGVVWNPWSSTTVRGGLFRTLQQPWLSPRALNPSLEPTQVGGFNQFFLGSTGDTAWRYGAGIDQKLPHRLYAGAEILFSNVEATFWNSQVMPPIIVRRDRDLQNSRAYLNWAPLSWLALSGQYLFERVDADITGGFYGVEEAKKIRTHQGIIGARFFHPLGFILGTSVIYIDQKGDFVTPKPDGSFSTVENSDRFWVTDASISYRLPKRFGIVGVEAKNIFNRKFHFQDTDPGNPRIMPGRLLLFKITLAF